MNFEKGASENPETRMVRTIDGSSKGTVEALDAVVHFLESADLNGDRIDDIKKTVRVGIENAVTYANHGDAKKSIVVELSVNVAKDSEGSVEISIAGEDKAVEASSPTEAEASLQGARAGDLFMKLPAGIEVTLFPEENRVILKRNAEPAGE